MAVTGTVFVDTQKVKCVFVRLWSLVKCMKGRRRVCVCRHMRLCSCTTISLIFCRYNLWIHLHSHHVDECREIEGVVDMFGISGENVTQNCMLTSYADIRSSE